MDNIDVEANNIIKISVTVTEPNFFWPLTESKNSVHQDREYRVFKVTCLRPAFGYFC